MHVSPAVAFYHHILHPHIQVDTSLLLMAAAGWLPRYLNCFYHCLPFLLPSLFLMMFDFALLHCFTSLYFFFLLPGGLPYYFQVLSFFAPFPPSVLFLLLTPPRPRGSNLPQGMACPDVSPISLISLLMCVQVARFLPAFHTSIHLRPLSSTATWCLYCTFLWQQYTHYTHGLDLLTP